MEAVQKTPGREAFYKKILVYAGIVVVVGPLLAWAAMVLPGWL